MESEKMSEALRLAEYMDAPLSDPKDVADAAAAELRRLYALVMDQQGKIYGLNFARETERKIHGLVKAECDALRADAERYRWLRDPANAYRDEWNYFGPYSSEAEIDAVIDAARAALKEAK